MIGPILVSATHQNHIKAIQLYPVLLVSFLCVHIRLLLQDIFSCVLQMAVGLCWYFLVSIVTRKGMSVCWNTFLVLFSFTVSNVLIHVSAMIIVWEGQEILLRTAV